LGRFCRRSGRRPGLALGHAVAAHGSAGVAAGQSARSGRASAGPLLPPVIAAIGLSPLPGSMGEGLDDLAVDEDEQASASGGAVLHLTVGGPVV
jgi:hypothetical protein